MQVTFVMGGNTTDEDPMFPSTDKDTSATFKCHRRRYYIFPSKSPIMGTRFIFIVMHQRSMVCSIIPQIIHIRCHFQQSSTHSWHGNNQTHVSVMGQQPDPRFCQGQHHAHVSAVANSHSQYAYTRFCRGQQSYTCFCHRQL